MEKGGVANAIRARPNTVCIARWKIGNIGNIVVHQ
jgi:hypothetical protein